MNAKCNDEDYFSDLCRIFCYLVVRFAVWRGFLLSTEGLNIICVTFRIKHFEESSVLIRVLKHNNNIETIIQGILY